MSISLLPKLTSLPVARLPGFISHKGQPSRFYSSLARILLKRNSHSSLLNASHNRSLSIIATPNPFDRATKKTYKIGTLLLLAAGILCYSLHPKTVSLCPDVDEKLPLKLASEKGKKQLKLCEQQHPEVLGLSGSTCYQLLSSLECLRLLLDGSQKAYEEFTKAQDVEKLSLESFQELHGALTQLLHSGWKKDKNSQPLTSTEIACALETALVLSYLGKDDTVRKQFLTTYSQEPDFYSHLLRHVLTIHPGRCPSFAKLSSLTRALLIQTAPLMVFQQLVRLDGDYRMLERVYEITAKRDRGPYDPGSYDSIALSFALLVHTCYTAGALGNVDRYDPSPSAYTESVHQTLHIVEDTAKNLSTKGIIIYKDYFNQRAAKLGLDHTRPEDRVLTRIGASLGFCRPEDGSLLQKALQTLPRATCRAVHEPFSGLEIRDFKHLIYLLICLTLHNKQQTRP